MKQHWYNFKQVRNAVIHNDSIKQKRTDSNTLLPLKLSVVVWNIFKRHGAELFDKDLISLKDNTDIFCLQEVLANKELHLPALFNQMNYNYGISYLRSDNFCEGVLTISDYCQQEEAHSLLSLSRELITKTPKAALISLYPLIDGRQLLVINLHMLLYKRKKTMTLELQQILDTTHQYSHCPAIFSGDFNTFTAKQRELVDIILASDGYNRCFPEYEPRGARYLDHIYVRGMKTSQVKIFDHITSSDHYPLFCQLEISHTP